MISQDVELPDGCQLMRHRYGKQDDLIRLLIVGVNPDNMVRVRMNLYYQTNGNRFVRLNVNGRSYAIIA